MIITRLMGGLGNQMFQYASALAVVKKHHTELFIDKSWFSKIDPSEDRSYNLDCFTLTPNFIKPDEYIVVKNMGLLNRLNKKSVIEYKEKGLLYDDRLLNSGSRILMDGYWQSEKYFKKYRDDVLKAFSFQAPLRGKNRDIQDLMKKTNSVSLHVRRGDYANKAHTNAVHGLTSLEYYEQSINLMSDTFEDIHLFIFSDEPEWCKANMKLKTEHTFISGNKGCDDLQLMSSCNHHIIANSSFSWWGAWLNPSDEKMVIAPNKWFNDKSLNSRDLVPESWKRI